MNKLVYTLLVVLIIAIKGRSQELITYKAIDALSLKMKIIYPEQFDEDKKYPSIVFFFGGGWNEGDMSQFEMQAEYFSSREMVCFLPDYRVYSRQHTSPFESLKDAKSAIRFIRKHADEFHIDGDKLVGSGGSAGGHLAAALCLNTEF